MSKWYKLTVYSLKYASMSNFFIPKIDLIRNFTSKPPSYSCHHFYSIIFITYSNLHKRKFWSKKKKMPIFPLQQQHLQSNNIILASASSQTHIKRYCIAQYIAQSPSVSHYNVPVNSEPPPAFCHGSNPKRSQSSPHQ